MSKKINRRRFIAESGKYSVAVVAGSLPLRSTSSLFHPPSEPDIAIVTGEHIFENTIKAIQALGGMTKFVPNGSKVGVLINSDFELAGTYVNPDISIALIKMIVESGASELVSLQVIKEEYWKRSTLYEENKPFIEKIKQVESNTFPSEFNEKDFVRIDKIEGAKSLKETEVVKAWLNCDVFINVPIAKHHMTTLLTGALKNIMGVSTRKCNIQFHLGSGEKNNPDYLAQCIVDQHLLKRTSLCVADATELITTNGTEGTGNLIKPLKIIAGTDIVAIDAFCSELMGYDRSEILTNIKGAESGLGTSEYEKLQILEINS